MCIFGSKGPANGEAP